MFLVSIIIIVFGILQIILFFKIWGMTNNVSSIRKWTEKKLSNSVYKNRYNSVISYYEKRINKVQGKLDKEKYESFDKVNAIISKI